MEGVTDKELFDQSISTETVAPEVSQEPAQAAPEPTSEQQQIARDEQGRFAPKTEAEVQQQAAQSEPPQGFVPSGRLREVSERATNAERELARAQAQLEIFQRHQPQPALQPPKVPTDIFENPDEAIRERIAPQFQEINQVILSLAKDNAELRFTPEKVSAAEQAFIQATQARTLDVADYNRVVNSPNRYAAAVQWHQQQQVMKEVGGDPEVYKSRILDEAMKDPAFQAKVIEAARANASGQQPGKTGTVVQLPPSINRSASAASPHETGGDLSDSSLYSFATR
jgi:hypothetical protein